MGIQAPRSCIRKMLESTVIGRFAMPIINLVDLSARNFLQKRKNVGNVSKFGSPRMSLFLPKIIVVDCIEKMSEEIPDRLGSTAYLLNLMKAFCTHCALAKTSSVCILDTNSNIRVGKISPKENKKQSSSQGICYP